MIFVDSSVWIDLLRDRSTRQVDWLYRVEPHDILVGDLVLMEVLQGARDELDARRLTTVLAQYGSVEVFGEEMARATARNFRFLRSRGIALRRQIDLVLGTFCLMHDHECLYADKDFGPMVRHLGLRPAAGSLPPH